MIEVKNNASQSIEIAINKWGDSGKTGFYPKKHGESGTWDRTDDRGFVMMVKKSGSTTPYYVQHNSVIVVSSNEVRDRGAKIESIG